MTTGSSFTDLVSKLDKAISQGLQSQRIRRVDESMEYIDPKMNALFKANMDFSENPNRENLNALKTSVKESDGKDSFNWDEIKTMLKQLESAIPQRQHQAKP